VKKVLSYGGGLDSFAMLLSAIERGELPDYAVFRYNPYLFDSFVRADTLEPVHEADAVTLNEEGAWARKPR